MKIEWGIFYIKAWCVLHIVEWTRTYKNAKGSLFINQEITTANVKRNIRQIKLLMAERDYSQGISANGREGYFKRRVVNDGERFIVKVDSKLW